MWGCRVSSVESVRFKCLRKLTLIYVKVDDGTLGTITSGCPLLRSLVIESCLELRNVMLSEVALPELKHFDLESYEWREECSIVIHALNLQTICIKGPWIWSNCQSTFLFSRLTSVNLSDVIMLSELFDLLSFGCPILESLTLDNCLGFEEFHLANDSVKYLRISTGDDWLKEVRICAPNIVSFDFTANIPQAPPDIFSFTTTTSKEWYSNVILSSGEKHHDFDANWWFLKLRRMLKTLSGSQISLTLQMDEDPQNVPCSSVVSDEPPVVVRDLDFTTCKRRTMSWYSEFTNYLFRFCRPSHVYGCRLVSESAKNYRLSKFQFNILLAKMSLRTEPCFWQHDLEQVFVESFDGQQWQLMQWTKMGKLRKRKQDRMIRLRLKWRFKNVSNGLMVV
ncbi:Putative F-box/LRR-repeat protein [Striga hermonthica]|uniref:F-box/LRR-repeat protein n=1 Tax=Striga hermonthica TaxID=68872 RepID=A0A9N7NN23_STRHE|nr:Putative F-box/LRR-repeat protein [Striga hermonthica]